MNNIFICEMECTISTLETEKIPPFILKNSIIREYNIISKGTMTSHEFKKMFYVGGHDHFKVTLHPEKDMTIGNYNYNSLGGTEIAYNIKGSHQTFQLQEHIMLDYEKDLGIDRKCWSLQSFYNIERDLKNINFMEKTPMVLKIMYARHWNDVARFVNSDKKIQLFYITLRIKNLNPNIRDHLLNIYYQIKDYEDIVWEKEEIYDCYCGTAPLSYSDEYNDTESIIDSDLESQIQKVHLKEGWNYYSNYLVPFTGKKLSDYIPNSPELDGAIIENSFASPPIKSKYYLNIGWFPNCKISSIFTAFKIKLYQAHTIILNGYLPTNDEWELQSGWNMLGYPYKNSMNLKDFLKEDNISAFKDGDLIKILKYDLCINYTNYWTENYICRKNQVLHIKLNGFNRKFQVKLPAPIIEEPDDLLTQTINLNIGVNMYGNHLIPYAGMRLNDYIPPPNKSLWGATVQNPYVDPPINSTYYKDFGWYPNSEIPNIFIAFMIIVKYPTQISFKGYKPTDGEIKMHSGWNLIGYPYDLNMNISDYFIGSNPFFKEGDYIYALNNSNFLSTQFYPQLNCLYPNFELKQNMALKIYLNGDRECTIKYESPKLIKIINKKKKKSYKLKDNLHMILKKIGQTKIKKISIKIKNVAGLEENILILEDRSSQFYEKNQVFVTELIEDKSLLWGAAN